MPIYRWSSSLPTSTKNTSFCSSSTENKKYFNKHEQTIIIKMYHSYKKGIYFIFTLEVHPYFIIYYYKYMQFTTVVFFMSRNFHIQKFLSKSCKKTKSIIIRFFSSPTCHHLPLLSCNIVFVCVLSFIIILFLYVFMYVVFPDLFFEFK